MKANKNGVGRSLVEYAVIFLLVAIITAVLLCVLALLLINAGINAGVWLVNSWEIIRTSSLPHVIGKSMVGILIFTAIWLVFDLLFGR